jgi:phage tail-like protein
MNDLPKPRYAILRDGQNWEEVTISGLEVDSAGALTLARVPATLAGEEIDLTGSFSVEPSGIVVGECSDLFIADTANHRVIWNDGVCKTRMLLPIHPGEGGAPGQFREPRGLLLGAAGLYVADSQNARVQIFRIPTLEPRAIWSGYFDTPTSLAKDGLGRVYVLDTGLRRVLRFSAWGTTDAAYNTIIATQFMSGVSPKFLAVDETPTLYVLDAAGNAVLRFDEDGRRLLNLPASGGPSHPGAIAAYGGRLYVADTADGMIQVFDVASNVWVGAVVGYRGPVTAMTFDDAGTLYVKPGCGETEKANTPGCCSSHIEKPSGGEIYYKLAGDAAWVSGGRLVAGPLDAGERLGWFHLNVETEVAAGTEVKLEIYVSNDPNDVPVWMSQQSLDVLLPQYASEDQPQLKDVFPTQNPEPDRIEPQRYLWLRVFANSANGRVTPRILQVQAETPGEDYMEYLPGVYRRKDRIETRSLDQPQDIGFLRRWLALFRSELGNLEQKLDELPRRFNAATVAAEDLPWLASWLAFDPPPGVDTDTLRKLLQRVLELYRRRGTLFGVREFVGLYSGVRPRIVESFRQRRIWQLGHTSLLGFDTALASIEPHGAILPDTAAVCESGCDTAEAPNRLVIGSFVVGESGPLAGADFGEPLFSDTAHHFSVFVSTADVPDPARRETLRRAVDAERPAHADYDLCIVEPRMRVGLQANLGVDSYVAGPPEPLVLTGTVLGLTSYLGEEAGERGASRFGQHARLGTETILE